MQVYYVLCFTFPEQPTLIKQCKTMQKKQSTRRQPNALVHLRAEAAGHFSRFPPQPLNPPHITTIERATLLSQSKDQNISHVSKEQMSQQLGWCEHRYNADRKQRQSLVEPIMGRAVGAGLQTALSCVALRYMINFLTKSRQTAHSLPSLQVATLLRCGTERTTLATAQRGLRPPVLILFFYYPLYFHRLLKVLQFKGWLGFTAIPSPRECKLTGLY